MNGDIKAGQVLLIDYPFCREKVTLWDDESSGEIESWRPGIRFEDTGYSGPESEPETFAAADAMGKMRLEVISRHKPGKYPERVFYTRRWIDPDGKEFGKKGLQVMTMKSFKGLLRGYRYPYIVGRTKK